MSLAPGSKLQAVFGADRSFTFDMFIRRTELDLTTMDDVWMAIGLLGANKESLSTVLLRLRLSDGDAELVVVPGNNRVKFNLPRAELATTGAIPKPGLYYYDLWVSYAGKEEPLCLPGVLEVVAGVGP